MSKIYASAEMLVGNTPLVELAGIEKNLGLGAKILAKLEEKLGIKNGDCTEDGEFSLEASRCIGACGLAPVFTINEDVYGRVKEDGSELDGILAKYKA